MVVQSDVSFDTTTFSRLRSLIEKSLRSARCSVPCERLCLLRIACSDSARLTGVARSDAGRSSVGEGPQDIHRKVSYLCGALGFQIRLHDAVLQNPLFY